MAGTDGREGKSRWLGTSRWLGFEVCQSMRRVLLQEGDAGLGLSKRGTHQLDEVRDLIPAPECQGSLLFERLPSGQHRWWTFAGGAVNSALALRLGENGMARVDDLWVETDADVLVPELIQRPLEDSAMTSFSERMAEQRELKFAACLRPDLVVAVVAGRSIDEENHHRLVSG